MERQSSAAAAAAAPPATAALPVPDEAVWRLLLGELWQPPEQQVVCRLLTCSRAMARLVHEACAGRVHMTCKQPRDEGNSAELEAARGRVYGAWLAKHARLLAQLQLCGWQDQEQHVAAGLRAAAGVGGPAQRMTRAMAASQSAATRAAEAAAAAGPAAVSAPQELPLRSLVWDSSTCFWALLSSDDNSDDNSGPLLLDSLAACPQLTRLQLCGRIVAGGRVQKLATAFTALRHLRELSLELRRQMAVPALQLGTQLTKLRLMHVALSATAFSSLPTSLVELEHVSYDALPPAGHLTALTCLQCWGVNAGSSVPPSVEVLQLGQCHNPALLHHLTRLRALDCGDTRCSLEQLQAAVAAIGPSLTSLNLAAATADVDVCFALLAQHVSGPSLPLTGLALRGCSTVSLAHLGQWTGLTRLELWCLCFDTPRRVAQQLQQLTALRELHLQGLQLSGFQQASLQPLVDGVVGMSSLRSLVFKCELDVQQRARLQGMTQLTRLEW